MTATSSAGTELLNATEADQYWHEVRRGKELMESRQLQDAGDVLNDALKGLEKICGKISVEPVPAIRFLASTNAKLRHERQQRIRVAIQE